jgi:hypothetical protein
VEDEQNRQVKLVGRVEHHIQIGEINMGRLGLEHLVPDEAKGQHALA